ncbi:MAG: hypothetical protein GY772_23285 [bacterium]|nr:hypothetical protein [bacterium]
MAFEVVLHFAFRCGGAPVLARAAAPCMLGTEVVLGSAVAAPLPAAHCPSPPSGAPKLAEYLVVLAGGWILHREVVAVPVGRLDPTFGVRRHPSSGAPASAGEPHLFVAANPQATAAARWSKLRRLRVRRQQGLQFGGARLGDSSEDARLICRQALVTANFCVCVRRWTS